MEYKIKRTVPLTKLIVTSQGVFDSLCSNCQTKDCTNPIEEKEVSVFGILKKIRLNVRGSYCSVVVDCEGFSLPVIKKNAKP